jgi:hypothetical protein
MLLFSSFQIQDISLLIACAHLLSSLISFPVSITAHTSPVAMKLDWLQTILIALTVHRVQASLPYSIPDLGMYAMDFRILLTVPRRPEASWKGHCRHGFFVSLGRGHTTSIDRSGFGNRLEHKPFICRNTTRVQPHSFQVCPLPSCLEYDDFGACPNSSQHKHQYFNILVAFPIYATFEHSHAGQFGSIKHGFNPCTTSQYHQQYCHVYNLSW